MKTIVLKTVTDETPGFSPTMFSYSKVLIQILVGATPHGMTLDEMRKRMRVADALDGVDEGEVQLGVEDYRTLMEALQNFRWARLFEAALRMEEELKRAKAS